MRFIILLFEHPKVLYCNNDNDNNDDNDNDNNNSNFKSNGFYSIRVNFIFTGLLD